jgi:hypothetical protein
MNERFEELARQSGALPTQDCGVPQWYIDEDVFEKFAELLVRECMDVCKSRVGNSDYNTGRMHCASDIKDHFGVEQ